MAVSAVRPGSAISGTMVAALRLLFAILGVRTTQTSPERVHVRIACKPFHNDGSAPIVQVGVTKTRVT